MHTFAAGTDCPWDTCSHHRKHRQTSTQQPTFFSATPLSHPDKCTTSAKTPGLTCLLGFPPRLSVSVQPVLPRSPGPGRLQSLSHGDAPQNLCGFILGLPASPGCSREEGSIVSQSHFPLGPTTPNKDPPLMVFGVTTNQYGLKWEAYRLHPIASACSHSQTTGRTGPTATVVRLRARGQ